jgi:SPASM domain peptide maturase of grasp-with-spasm system
MKEFRRYIIDGYLLSIEQNLDRESYIQVDKLMKLDSQKLDFLEYNYPSWITNTIIEQKGADIKGIEQIIFHVEKLLCKFIVIKIDEEITLGDFKNILEIVENHNIHRCLFLLMYSEDFYTDNFLKIILNSSRINGIVFFNSPFDKNLENFIFYYQLDFSNKNGVSKGEFTSNRILFSESQKHNTYFNRKLYISSSGEIKNAPETEQIFGYIQDIKSEDELKQIISSPEFQKYWFVHKDLIDVCKECEFRHMCVDNRVPIQRANYEWFHNMECNYNPYIGKWKGDGGFLTLEECGIISNERGFLIDNEKLDRINSAIVN